MYGSPHPERPDRLRAVMARLLSSGLAGMSLLTFILDQPAAWLFLPHTLLLLSLRCVQLQSWVQPLCPSPRQQHHVLKMGKS